MLAIKPEQFDAMERAALKKFEDEMVPHLLEFAPAHCKGVGEPGLRELIRAGIVAAKTYGFTLKGPVRFYIECMVMFGWKFDTDPLLPWAWRELRVATLGGELAGADRLHAAAMGYRDAVMGPEFAAENAAIKKLVTRPVEAWLASDPSDRGLAATLRAVWPERCDHSGPTGIGAVIAGGRHLARIHGLTPPGAIVFTALLLAFGHGCPTDPQFGWIAETVAATAGQPPAERADKLAARMFGYLTAGQ